MGKVALMALLVLVVFFLLRDGAAKRKAPSGRRSNRSTDDASLVKCANCGTYLPEADALRGRSGNYYCDAVHRQNSGDENS